MVRAMTVSRTSSEMPNMTNAAAMKALVTTGASSPPNNTRVKALRTRSKRRGVGDRVRMA